MDVGSRGAEHPRPKESLRRHAFGGVLARQPVPIVGQVVGRDVAPDGKKTCTAHPDLLSDIRSGFAACPKAVQRCRNRIRQLPQPLHGRQDGRDISVRTKTADHGGGSARRNRMPVCSFVSRVNIGDMDLDFRAFEYLEGIDQRDRCE